MNEPELLVGQFPEGQDEEPALEDGADARTSELCSRLCSAIIKTGKNKGNKCNCKVLNDNIYCGRHIKQNINN